MRLHAVTYLARDYDEAIAWFRDVLGFTVLQDDALSDAKRWVRVAASPDAETSFLIAKAVGEQISQIGHAAADRVAYFLSVDDFQTVYNALRAKGVVFEEEPRHEPYGSVAVFVDLYGNRWDLLQLR